MKILAFDSSSLAFSVALLCDEEVLAKNIFFENGRQSEMLICEIEKILNQNQIWYQDLDLIASTRGPGSFTGTRISLTTARILKIALNLPLILLNCCEVLSYKYRQKSAEIFAIIDAKAGDLFYAKASEKPKLVRIENLLEVFLEQKLLAKIFICGSGKKIAAEILQKAGICCEISDGSDEVEADLVGLLAYEKWQKNSIPKGGLDDQALFNNFEPLYLRSPKISERKK